MGINVCEVMTVRTTYELVHSNTHTLTPTLAQMMITVRTTN